ncbi:hypothetical protein [Mycetocola sp.]|uniref:hypothetical protein n=1 Tax=Mycetocola sp. TaxID=1871042 RepID=UPI003989B071
MNRVDPESDRIGRSSTHLLGAKRVVEIIRSVEMGLDGRVSKRMENELKEADVSRHALTFLDILTEAFPDLRNVMDGTRTPADLRATSLLGSVLTLRVLAGAYHDLKKHHAFTDEAITDYFVELNDYMGGPVTETSIWHTELPDSFAIGAMAPQGRRQELKKFNQAVVAWGVLRPDVMNEPAEVA